MTRLQNTISDSQPPVHRRALQHWKRLAMKRLVSVREGQAEALEVGLVPLRQSTVLLVATFSFAFSLYLAALLFTG